MVKRKLRIVLLLMLLFSMDLSAQKVGLVLSGGGAKGVMHVGVIKALEEEGIPIDYITGTSMGAIIGGLYAAGYSPAEMEAILDSPEFNQWVTGEVDSKYLYFFKKSAPNASWLNFKFRVDSTIKPSLPTNIISPVTMDFAFMELFSSASAASGYNFDSLMVPFRCVASNIAEAKSVILQKGDLGKAIRASMTFPFYFKPIKIDDVLLFDGGMYNNFPSDIMLEDFYPDIIIGSQASNNFKDPDPNNVLSHLQNMLMMKNDYSVICDNSVLIKPCISETSLLDFSNSSALIDSGYVETKRKIAEIREFVTESRTEADMAEKRLAFNSKKPDLFIGNVEIHGLNSLQYQYINQMLTPEPSLDALLSDSLYYLTLKMIKPRYYRFLAGERIDNIYPSLLYDKHSGSYGLVLDIQRQNQLNAELGGTITSSSVNELFLQLQYFLWRKNSIQLTANSYFGRFYNSALIDGRIDFPTNNPFYLSAGFVFNKFNYFKTQTYFYSDDEPFYLIEQERFMYLKVGFPVLNDGRLIVELVGGNNRDYYFQTNNYTREDILDRTSFNFISPGVIFEINSLNHKEYPSRGVNLILRTNLVTGNEKFKPGTTYVNNTLLSEQHTWIQSSVTYENYYLHSGSMSFGLYGELYYSSQKYFTNYISSLLSASAFQPVAESNIRFLPIYRANRYLALGTKNIYKLSKSIDARLEGYLFVPNRAITPAELDERATPSKAIKVVPLFGTTVVYHSPLGPLSVNLNYFKGEDQPYSFLLKFGYLIFNRRPF